MYTVAGDRDYFSSWCLKFQVKNYILVYFIHMNCFGENKWVMHKKFHKPTEVLNTLFGNTDGKGWFVDGQLPLTKCAEHTYEC